MLVSGRGWACRIGNHGDRDPRSDRANRIRDDTEAQSAATHKGHSVHRSFQIRSLQSKRIRGRDRYGPPGEREEEERESDHYEHRGWVSHGFWATTS